MENNCVMMMYEDQIKIIIYTPSPFTSILFTTCHIIKVTFFIRRDQTCVWFFLDRAPLQVYVLAKFQNTRLDSLSPKLRILMVELNVFY